MSDPKKTFLKQELLLARAGAQAMIHEESAFSLHKLRRTHYETGEKAGKIFAYQLKKLEQKHSITSLRDSNGIIISDQLNTSVEGICDLPNPKRMSRTSHPLLSHPAGEFEGVNLHHL